MTDSRSPKKIVGGCVAVAVVVLIAVAQTSVGASVARAIGLASHSEPFTELYFAHPQRVAAATQGEDRLARRQVVSFVLANHESKPMTYAWTITSAGTRRSTGLVSVASDGTRTVTLPAGVPTGCQFSKTRSTGPSKSEITVSLSSPHDAISYWVACRG